MMLLSVMLLWTSITPRGVINPIVVAAPAGANSALYFVLRNSSQNEDRLVRVTCDCAERVETQTARRGDLFLGGESVPMPPARLVELRPGASRHLLLLRLRRPLVAGETLEMTFHYTRGSDVRRVRVVAEPQSGWEATWSEGEPRRLAAMNGLAGWCWRGTFPGGRRTDTRCFSPAYGSFMQDLHRVEGVAAPWVAHTIYSHDVMGRTTSYGTYAPDGTRRGGRIVPTADGVIFEEYPQQPTARWESHARTHWRRDGADAVLVTAEARRSAGWRVLWRLRMTRAGPSPPAD